MDACWAKWYGLPQHDHELAEAISDQFVHRCEEDACPQHHHRERLRKLTEMGLGPRGARRHFRGGLGSRFLYSLTVEIKDTGAVDPRMSGALTA